MRLRFTLPVHRRTMPSDARRTTHDARRTSSGKKTGMSLCCQPSSSKLGFDLNSAGRSLAPERLSKVALEYCMGAQGNLSSLQNPSALLAAVTTIQANFPNQSKLSSTAAGLISCSAWLLQSRHSFSTVFPICLRTYKYVYIL